MNNLAIFMGMESIKKGLICLKVQSQFFLSQKIFSKIMICSKKKVFGKPFNCEEPFIYASCEKPFALSIWPCICVQK